MLVKNSTDYNKWLVCCALLGFINLGEFHLKIQMAYEASSFFFLEKP